MNIEKKSALGRGLESLIPSRSENKSKDYFECYITDIVTNPDQPRKIFTKSAIDELAASIEEKGILQPLVVRSIGAGKYELIAGERRFRAASQLQMEKVPVIVKDIREEDVLELALIENIQRENLNPVEEAMAYRDLLSKFQYTQEELAKRLGKDRSSIANALRLLKLPDKIRDSLLANTISMGHARALLGVDDRELQIEIAKDVVEKKLSVRDTEELVNRIKNTVTQMPVAERDQPKSTVQDMIVENDVYIKEIVSDLKMALEAPVQVKGSKAKGKIIIPYSGLDQLNQIVQKLLKA